MIKKIINHNGLLHYPYSFFNRDKINRRFKYHYKLLLENEVVKVEDVQVLEYIICKDENVKEELKKNNNLLKLDYSNSDILQLNYTLYHLISLNCSNTKITRLPNTYLNIELLNISNTLIIKIPKSYLNLKELNCSNTLISKLSKKYNKLKKLIISNTLIKKIKYYPNLEYLDCNNNTNINIYINQYSYHDKLFLNKMFPINKLKYLILSNTKLTNKCDTIFSQYNSNIYKFSNLIYLDCSNTKLLIIPINLPNLKSLNISNTLITYLPNLTKLELLNANDSKLVKLNNNLINLQNLNIYNNYYIKKIPKTYINLQYLFIQNTNIKKLSKNFINLNYINCKNSKIKYLPINYYNKLYYLNIMQNNINCEFNNLLNHHSNIKYLFI